MAVETGILLESGTNELELLEFVVGNQHYGINVAKINELCPYQEPTMVPNAHEYIEGIFMPRERLITVIDLAKALGVQPSADTSHDMYIITNFNRLHTAFHVQQVLGIHRVSWKDIAKPDSTISGNGKGVATGITKINGRIIIVLDFEKIVTEVNPGNGT
ncbi:MAG: chemotaxis protein CheW [Clostridium sp.]